MSYRFPIERPILFGASSTCSGPFVYGSTQIAQFQTRWVCWVGTTGMRFGYYVPGVLFNDTDGQADDLYPGGTRPTHLSFSFEQDALHAIAIQQSLNTCAVRRKVSGTPTEYTFTGRSPVLFYNGIIEPDTAATDLMVFYIKAAGDKIYVRKQRDNFGIEYELNPTLNCTLRALQKTDALLINGANRQMLWAITTDGRQVYYQSGPYDPFPQYAEDRLSIALGFASGEYLEGIEYAFAPGDATTLDVSFVEGEYRTLLVNATAPGDSVSVDLGFVEGEHRFVAIEEDSGGDAAAVDVGFEEGELELIAIQTTLPADALSVDTGFDSGTYV